MLLLHVAVLLGFMEFAATAGPLWAINALGSQFAKTGALALPPCTSSHAGQLKSLCQYSSSLHFRKPEATKFRQSASSHDFEEVDSFYGYEGRNEKEADDKTVPNSVPLNLCRNVLKFKSGRKNSAAAWMPGGRSSAPISTIDNQHRERKDVVDGVEENTVKSKGWNGGSESTGMERIVDRIRRLRQMKEEEDRKERRKKQSSEEDEILENTYNKCQSLVDKEWAFSSSNGTPLEQAQEETLSMRLPLPWESSQEDMGSVGSELEKTKRVKAPTLAELTLSDEELKRLRTVGMRVKERIKINKSGITLNVVAQIHEKWKTSELVRIKFDEPYNQNMKRAHLLAEDRTGGLVIWRSGSVLLLYRGENYKPLSIVEIRSQVEAKHCIIYPSEEIKSFVPDVSPSKNGLKGRKIFKEVESMERDADSDSRSESKEGATELPVEAASATEDSCEMTNLPDRILDPKQEINSILEGLGPRFIDWWGYDPLPIDADLLPEVVPDFKPPVRLLPHGIKRAALSNSELTNLRKLAKPLHTHFALGRNRRLQGLASAILKLWERCEIVKIAVKRGVQNTNNKLMTEEIVKNALLVLMQDPVESTKPANSTNPVWFEYFISQEDASHATIMKHTGGVVLLRDKFYIIIYRGKDFLPPLVARVLTEKATETKVHQDEEENARSKAASSIRENSEIVSSVAGTLMESLEAHKRWKLDTKEQRMIIKAANEAKQAAAIIRLHRKLQIAQKKKENAEKQLTKLEAFLAPAEPQEDIETITNEERFMFRKLGLRMSPFLLLGRRGVFDGVVENMHLHWKYRELVKIISKGNSYEVVGDTARLLENESGGILVAIERVSKGYAIIFYRGKNYQRPSKLRPNNLLNKRKALQRSVEYQRREALSFHIYQLEQNINKLLCDIRKQQNAGVGKIIAGTNDEVSFNDIEDSDHFVEVQDGDEVGNMDFDCKSEFESVYAGYMS